MSDITVPRSAATHAFIEWPKGVPRPSTDEALNAARTQDLEMFGTKHDLRALVARGATAKEVFHELLRLSKATSFHIDAGDRPPSKYVRKLLSGNVTRNIADAIRTSNGMLLNVLEPLLKSTDVKLDMVISALSSVEQVRDSTGRTSDVHTVTPGSQRVGGNSVFAFHVLAICKDTLGSSCEQQIASACEKVLRKTGAVCLAPYAGLTEKEGLTILTDNFPNGLRPESPHYLSLLERLRLPADALEVITGRADLEKFPTDTLHGILGRAFQIGGVPRDNLARVAGELVLREGAMPRDDLLRLAGELALRSLEAKQ